MLSNTDLAAYLFGWISLGLGIWTYVPQIVLNIIHRPEKGGMNWWLLGIWLIGDMMSFSYYYLSGAPINQFILTGFFALGDVIVIFQQLLFQGYLPEWCCCGAGYRKTRADRRADRGENALTIKTGLAMMHRAPDIRVNFNIGDEKLKSGARRQRSRYARRRAADVEAGIQRSKRERVLDKLGVWGDKTARALDSTFGQVIAIYVLTSIMIGIWVARDLSQRDTRTLVPISHPVGFTKWLAWSLGWLGWMLFNGPRLVQIRDIMKEKTTNGLAIGVFTLLTLENICECTQVWVISSDPGYRFGAAPAFASSMTPLVFDGYVSWFDFILYLYFLYGNKKELPPSKLHWTYAWGRPISTSDFERRLAWSNGTESLEEEDLQPLFASPPLKVILPHHYPDEATRANAHRYRDAQTKQAIAEGHARNEERRREAAEKEAARQYRKLGRHRDKVQALVDTQLDREAPFVPPAKRDVWRKAQRQRLRKQFSSITSTSNETSSTVRPVEEVVKTWEQHQEAQGRNDEAREEYLRIQGLPLRSRSAPLAAYHRKFIQPGGYEDVQREERAAHETYSSDSNSSDDDEILPERTDRFPLLPRMPGRPRLSRNTAVQAVIFEEGGDIGGAGESSKNLLKRNPGKDSTKPFRSSRRRVSIPSEAFRLTFKRRLGTPIGPVDYYATSSGGSDSGESSEVTG